MMASPALRIYLLATAVGLAACTGKSPPVPVQPSSSISALEVVELRPGSGPAITAGQKAIVQYTGWLYETAAPERKGKQFDSSRNAGKPFSFVVGQGQVIKGWDQGVLGMKPGGSRRLVIPAELGYGDVGAGALIPPGATLVFDVELVAVE